MPTNSCAVSEAQGDRRGGPSDLDWRPYMDGAHTNGDKLAGEMLLGGAPDLESCRRDPPDEAGIRARWRPGDDHTLDLGYSTWVRASDTVPVGADLP